MIGWAGRWTQTPSPAKIMKCSFLDYVQLLVIGQAGQMDSNPICHPSPAKNKNMLIFGLHSTSDDQPGWSMDSNTICHPSTATKIKCSFLDYVQLLMIGWAGRWTQTPSPAKIMKCSFLDYIQLLMISWAGQMDSNTICHPSPAKNMKYSFLDYVQHLMVRQAGRWTRTPYAKPLQPKEWNAHFWITFNFWWLAWPGQWTRTPSATPLQPQNMKMLIFGLHSTSYDQPGWSMDSNTICHPSTATKIKCSFLDYVQLLMIGRAGQWAQTPSATSQQQKKWNAHFWIMFNFWWLAGLVDGLKPHLQPK